MIRVSSPVFVSLLLCAAVAVVKANSGDNPVRNKREWIIPPKRLHENKDYTKEDYIAKIRSDFESDTNIIYSLEGIGASENPFHVFVVDPKTGLIRVTKVLDREDIDMYNLSGVAKFSDGREAEKRIDIRIKVVDENDNSPVFGVINPGEVDELSPVGTSVMKVIATDADEPGNENSQIAYTIVDQNPPNDMFSMTKDGTIYVKRPDLDREKADQYILTVRGQDRNGMPDGNTGTGTVTINVRDVNDNLPTLEKEMPVDYENVKDLELGLVVRNTAPPYDGSGVNAGTAIGLVGGPSGASGASGTKFKTYPIKINVKNQPEGPQFDPKVKAIHISEGGDSINIKDVIAHYPAIDGDTGEPAENVRYAKGSDPGNWLIIDPETAEIKLNKMPDRESPLLVNGTYFAEVLCITEDMPAKTATGTVAIQVQDFNDHCPTLTSNIQTVCTTVDAVIVNAKDEDAFPNGPPFHFDIIPEGTEGKWHVEHLNDTAAVLRSQGSVWPGFYEVEFLVKDGQGKACPEPQKVKVKVCTCEDGVVCGKRGANGIISKEAELGPAGIGLLLLGLLLLLLIPLLLLFCQCGASAGLPGGFTQMPFDAKSHLINYHTEGQGENTKASNGNENLGVKDGLLVYEFEGQGSSVGSVGCCSLLESDNDLQFLDDLGPKFKTLAEVCGGKKIPTEVKQMLTPLPSASIKTQTSVSSLTTAQQLTPPSKLQPTVPRTEQTVVTETSECAKMVKESTATSREGMTTVKQGMANQGQMLLLQQQQPVYYTTTPMLQPMHYVVQPQVQNTMVLAEAPATNLQGMVLVNGTQTGPAQGMVVQGQTAMSSGQGQGPGMVLVERSGVQGGGANLIHAGNLSGSQTMMVVEGKVPAGSMQVLSGSQTRLVQGGTLQSGGLSGSQRVLVVGGQTSSGGQLVHEAGGLSQMSNVLGSKRVLHSQDNMSTGSQSGVVASSATTVSTAPTYRKVVVQETREIH
eukprot:superscaffoldBa00000525_g5404